MRRPVNAPRRLATLMLGVLLVAGVAAPVASAAPPSKDVGFGETSRRLATPGTRGKVNAREVLNRQSPMPRATKDVSLPRPGAATGTSRAPSGAGILGAPAPIEATTTANPPVGLPGFTGLTSTSGPDTNTEPPDPYVAAGPDHVAQTTNVSLRITDRRGGLPAAISLFDFFGLPDGFNNTDPRVHYDSLHGRWIVTEVSWICEAEDGQPYGYFDMLVSDTADPLGNFTLWYWEFAGAVPDYAALGSSTDKLAFGANVFELSVGSPSNCLGSGSAYIGADIEIFDWADLLADGGPNGVLDTFPSFGGQSFSTPRVATQAPATSPTLQVIVEHTVDGLVFTPHYLTYSGSVVGGTIDIVSDMDLTEEGVAGAWVEPPDPRQPGPDTVTSNIDSRPTDAVWQNGRLVFVATHGCTPTGDTIERGCIRVTELDTNGATASTPPELTQDFLIAADGKDYYFGGVGFALDGTLHAQWTRSSTTAGDYPSSYAAYQLRSDANDSISPPELLIAGTGVYTGNRWGDYTGIAQDPQVPNAVWQGNQYSGGGNNWSTYVSQLQTGGSTFQEITPVRVLDTRPGIAIGLSGPFAHGIARSWTVAGFGGGTIPSNAIAVTGNLTVTNQTAAGYVSVTPAPNNNPASSTINFPLGDTRANNLTIPVNTNGRVSAVYRATAGGTAHLIFDVTGYFVAGSGEAEYTTITPVRALDTRPGIAIGLSGAFRKDIPRRLSIGPAHVPDGAVAITGNLTVVGQTGAGYLSITPTSDSTPDTSNLNFPLGDTRANGFVAPLNAQEDLWIVYKTTAGGARSAHVLLDVTGYFIDDAAGLQYFPLTPGRTMDTRNVPLSGLNGPFAANSPRRLQVGGHWGVPAGAEAITGNLTAVGQTAAGYVSATLNSELNPTTSVLNFPLGDVRANGVTLPLNAGGRTWFVYKAPNGRTTNLILDVSGYFE
jgi:hypothetical protein